MVVLVFVFVLNYGIAARTSAPAASAAAPIPRSKAAKGNLISRTLGSSFFNRIVRDFKSAFSSELESLALQVNSPFLRRCMF